MPQQNLEVRKVSVDLGHAVDDLRQITDALPAAVDLQTMTRLRELAEHLADLSGLLGQEVK